MLTLIAQVSIEPTWYSIAKDFGLPGAIALYLIWFGTRRLIPAIDELKVSIEAQEKACAEVHKQNTSIDESLARIHRQLVKLVPDIQQ